MTSLLLSLPPDQLRALHATPSVPAAGWTSFERDLALAIALVAGAAAFVLVCFGG